MTITHTFVSAKTDGADNTVVQPSDWNASHTIADPYFLPSKTTITLTDAQIKALPSSPYTLIAAPGAGKVILPISCIASSIGIEAYTNVGDTLGVFVSFDGIQYQNVFAVPEIGLGQSLFNAGSIIYFASNNIQRYSASDPEVTVGLVSEGDGKSAPYSRASSYSSHINRALKLYVDNYGAGYDPNLGDFTGGNAANTLKVTVIYHVITL